MKSIITYFTTFLLLISGGLAFAQKRDAEQDKDKIQIALGVNVHFNSANEGGYLKAKSRIYQPINHYNGITLKFTLPTKKEYLDVFFGALVEFGDHRGGTNDIDYRPGKTNASYNRANGGGVYVGISPKVKGKHLGLTSEIGIGVFSYKNNFSHYNNTVDPILNINDKKTTFGLGAIASAGFYVKFWRIGINPNVNVLFTGGNNTSFLFYGFNFPLTFQF